LLEAEYAHSIDHRTRRKIVDKAGLGALPLLQYPGSRVEVAGETNISSAYYLASRVLYSRICQDSGTQPDYFDAHHRYASALPFCGEFGPVRMLCLKKR
jgi:hypothetical protein